MQSLHCQVTYRPARVGWLVREDSLDEVLAAIRLSCCLWGGHSFPILPSQDIELRRAIVDRYLPDLIALPSGFPADTSSCEDLKHLIWPFFNRPLFAPGVEGPELLDVRHALMHLEEARVRRFLPSDFEVFDVTWDQEDPLRYAYSAMFGDFAKEATAGFDYRGVSARRLDARKMDIAPGGAVPAELLGRTLPLLLAMWKVQHHAGEQPAAIYVGDCTSPIDLIRFWNLRASGAFTVFLDRAHIERLQSTRSARLGS